MAESSNKPHPRLGLTQPLKHLSGGGPLKYLHEGDLLRLRLTLENISLYGLETLAVQEVL